MNLRATGRRLGRIAGAAALFIAITGYGQPRADAIPVLDESRIERFALVIGVENYRNHRRVDNALNDAAVVGAALQNAGFAVSYPPREPETAYDLLRQIEDFSRGAGGDRQAATIVLYFAGHGFQSEGINYLVPRNAPKPGRTSAALVNASVSITDAVVALGVRRPGIMLLMVDACRTNILETDAAMVSASPLMRNRNPGGLRKGFQLMPPGDLQSAVLSLSTGYDDVARSSSYYEPKNSPYAWAMQQQIQKVSKKLNEVLDDVNYDVGKDTEYQGQRTPQQPISQNREKARNFYFRPDPKDGLEEDDLLKWVRSTNNFECVDYFLHSFPDGRFARSAVSYRDAQRGLPAIPCPRR